MYTGPTNTRTCIQRPPWFLLAFFPLCFVRNWWSNIAWHHLSSLPAKYLLANLTFCLSIAGCSQNMHNWACAENAQFKINERFLDWQEMHFWFGLNAFVLCHGWFEEEKNAFVLVETKLGRWSTYGPPEGDLLNTVANFHCSRFTLHLTKKTIVFPGQFNTWRQWPT